MPDQVEIARVAREITVIEARLIAARHLKLADRIRLLESEKRRLEARLAELRLQAGWEEQPVPVAGDDPQGDPDAL